MGQRRQNAQTMLGVILKWSESGCVVSVFVSGCSWFTSSDVYVNWLLASAYPMAVIRFVSKFSIDQCKVFDLVIICIAIIGKLYSFFNQLLVDKNLIIEKVLQKQI